MLYRYTNLLSCIDNYLLLVYLFISNYNIRNNICNTIQYIQQFCYWLICNKETIRVRFSCVCVYT